MGNIFNESRPLGIQMWTLKDEMAKDAKGTIEKVAKMGYQEVELFEGEKGILWGEEPKNFKRFIEDLGLQFNSTHLDPFNDFEKKVEIASEVGLEYLVCSWLGPNPQLDFYKKALERFNYCAEYCHNHGLKFAYHNHDYSLKPVEGVIPHELFLTQSDSDKLFFQMDVYWVVVAGHNPLDWLSKYPNRWLLVHLKDLSNEEVEGQPVSCVIGNGSIHYKELIPRFIDLGVEGFYVEQEYFEGETPMEAAKKNCSYLCKIKAN